ncbi:MAG TPA: bifunctional 3-(3-hydroxy-phenyl)propionate/3-hydroxycinnamic acid hydroxylase [Solirubrobacterales bacterium]|nr:bifunctional 3-(3-hydroxy-phenyl)propionate/3-hydroxycinnamic acid hydroxylase [Solirubrobacterales bacterium]
MSGPTHDVAIVGYGPTGMTLAALLGRAGHRVVVLERHPGLYNLPRAACFDDEIMRTFQKLGVSEEVLPGAIVQRDYDWVNGAGETLVEISYDDPAPGGWAQLYMMYQPHIEDVLDRLCRSLATVEVRQGVTVGALAADDGSVEVRGRDADGAEVEVRARFVVGADGGTGFVRPALGIGFDSYGFEENWLVCDFECPPGLDGVPTFRQVCDPAQPIAIVRIGPEHQRFSFMLEPDEDRTTATDPDRVWARVADYLTPADAELIRVANYVFRSRVAERWRQGRVLLAGDAAHEMPPFLAQGMCSGMRDAHNIAWKLDLVLRGLAGDALLDTYQPEREPHVRFITEKAIELGRVQTLRDPERARERDERMLAARAADRAPEKLRYPALAGGALTEGIGAPHAGEFFVQGRVGAARGEGLFDDIVGQGPCIVAVDGASAGLDGRRREEWAAIGGRIARLGDGANDERAGDGAAPSDGSALGDTALVDRDGTYAAWFDAHACAAAVVRPDWYLFGTAADGARLADLVDATLAALGGGR